MDARHKQELKEQENAKTFFPHKRHHPVRQGRLGSAFRRDGP
jgi:hypothetical protein